MQPPSPCAGVDEIDGEGGGEGIILGFGPDEGEGVADEGTFAVVGGSRDGGGVAGGGEDGGEDVRGEGEEKNYNY